MILREIFYYDKETMQPTEDDRYEPQYDDSIVDLDDTRQTRLTGLTSLTGLTHQTHQTDRPDHHPDFLDLPNVLDLPD